MNPIPPSMDELMWLIAEQDDPSALDTFGRRYPEYRHELGHRLQLVRGLKGSRPDQSSDSRIPAFELRPEPKPSIPRWAAVAASTVALLGVAFGSYVAIKRWNSAAPIPQPPPFVRIGGPQQQPGASVAPLQKPIESPPQNTAAIQDSPQRDTPVYEQPISIKLEGVSLVQAVSSVVRLSRFKNVEYAPGMPEIQVSIEYANMRGMDILRDMGKTFGFTAFEQEPGNVLLIPATDPTVHEPPKRDPATVAPPTSPTEPQARPSQTNGF